MNNSYKKIIKNTILRLLCENCGKRIHMKDEYYINSNTIINVLCKNCYEKMIENSNV